MLYVDDPDGAQWLRVLELLSEQTAFDMVLCLYPDSLAGEFVEPFAAPWPQEDLERVTTYEDGVLSQCSARVRVTAQIVDALRPHLGDFEDWGDSLALYPPRERSWVAAFVPHERVVLVRDERLHDFLDAAGVPVSHEPPEGLAGAEPSNYDVPAGRA